MCEFVDFQNKHQNVSHVSSERGQMLLWKMCAVTLLALLWCGSSHDRTALSAGLYSWFLHTTGCLYILSPDSTHSIQQLIEWTEGAPVRTAVRFVAFSDKNHHKLLILLSFFTGATSDMQVLVVLVLAVFTGERLLIHYLWSRSIHDIHKQQWMRNAFASFLVAGCNANVTWHDQPKQKAEMVKDAFWDYVAKVTATAEESLKKMRESEMGQEMK